MTFRHTRQIPLSLFRISYARSCNLSRTLPCKLENLSATGLAGEGHLHPAHIAHFLRAASWPLVKASPTVLPLALVFVVV